MDAYLTSDQVSTLVSDLASKFTQFALSTVSAIFLLVAGYIVARSLSRLIRSRLGRVERFDQTYTPILAQVAHYVVVGFTIILALAQFGVQTASLIAVIGAIGLAIGLALQGTLQNVAAGVMLLIIRPFRVGDWIEASSVSGSVEEIGLFMTQLRNFEGIFVAVPNSMIWSSKIINYSRFANRRLVLDVGISYSDDIDRAIAALTDMLNADPRVLAKPDPATVIVTGYGESAVNLQLRAWARRKDYWQLRFDMTKAIKPALDHAGISIPFPHRQIIVDKALRQELLQPQPSDLVRGQEASETRKRAASRRTE
jgi:small conductance mechanosensitive channel